MTPPADGNEDPRQYARDIASAAGNIHDADGTGIKLTHAVRATTTKIIIFLYAGSISFLFLMILFQGFHSGDFSKAIDQSMEVMKVMILPVVTFILGRYFEANSK